MNPIFQQVITAIEFPMEESELRPYSRIVKAGLARMVSKQTNGLLIQPDGQIRDIPDWAGKCTSGLLWPLVKDELETMPLSPVVKAGMTLLMHHLDSLSVTGAVEANQGTIAIAISAYTQALLAALGIDIRALQAIGQKADSVMGDPGKAAIIESYLQGIANEQSAIAMQMH